MFAWILPFLVPCIPRACQKLTLGLYSSVVYRHNGNYARLGHSNKILSEGAKEGNIYIIDVICSVQSTLSRGSEVCPPLTYTGNL